MKPLLVLLCLTLTGCRPEPAPTPPSPVSQRFTGTWLGHIKCDHIIDHQTGKEYLRGSQGGFVEVEPTKKP